MNIHFSEILIILLVAFIVIKPERLPEIARLLGGWFTWMHKATIRVKRYIHAVSVSKNTESFHE